MKKIYLILLLLSTVAYGQNDQWVVDGGLGVFGTEGSSLSQVKFLKIGWQEDLWYTLKQRFNGGAWLDSRGSGRSGSEFAGYQLGFEVSNDTYEGSLFSGPAVITNPDEQLGGHLQFNETLFFGIKDKSDNTIGISYNHFSSAGLEMPNQGRDFMGLEIKFPF